MIGGRAVSGPPCRPADIVGRVSRQPLRGRAAASRGGDCCPAWEMTGEAGEGEARGGRGVRGGRAAASGPGLTLGRDSIAEGTGPLAPLGVGAERRVGGRAPGSRGTGRADCCRSGIAEAILKVGPVPYRCDLCLSLSCAGRFPGDPSLLRCCYARPEGQPGNADICVPRLRVDCTRCRR